jgi:DNA-binding Lrp family transcriptional regulator
MKPSDLLIDNRILTLIQKKFPLVSDPYAEIGNQLGLEADEVYARVSALRKTLIRRIGAVFNSKQLGCASTLVAVAVTEPQKLIDQLQEIPAVTHCYERGGTPNLWFTLTCRDSAALSEQLEQLGNDHPSLEFIRLDAVKTYKIGVHFNMEGKE